MIFGILGSPVPSQSRPLARVHLPARLDAPILCHITFTSFAQMSRCVLHLCCLPACAHRRCMLSSTRRRISICRSYVPFSSPQFANRLARANAGTAQMWISWKFMLTFNSVADIRKLQKIYV